jgi:hypothetical protein
VTLDLPDKPVRPGRRQLIEKPPVAKMPGLIHAEPTLVGAG